MCNHLIDGTKTSLPNFIVLTKVISGKPQFLVSVQIDILDAWKLYRHMNQLEALTYKSISKYIHKELVGCQIACLFCIITAHAPENTWDNQRLCIRNLDSLRIQKKSVNFLLEQKWHNWSYSKTYYQANWVAGKFNKLHKFI